MQLKKFHIQRYRSLLDVTIDLQRDSLYIICGENNIGKTNVLRALDVYFNHIENPDIFVPKNDIPHHIYYGSQGAGSKTELTGTFLSNGKMNELQLRFWNSGKLGYKLNGKKCDPSTAEDILSSFRYFFVESHNIDIPSLISDVLGKDGLLPLDKKRSLQSKPLEKLQEFITLSQVAISDIEKDLNECFKNLTDFDGILKDKSIKINFGEYNKLREVIKTMTSITLFDGNNHGIATKGSGAQRAVFLTLMQFIAQNSKRKVIWGVDEPEAFLQPMLQKKVAKMLNGIATKEKQPVIITTHSQHLIDLSNLKDTYLFAGEVTEKTYARKPGQKFYEVNTKPVSISSDIEKATLIKNHLGITNNDGWAVMTHNIIVEGEEDKKYLEKLLSCINLPVPNIVFSGGASKIGGHLQFFNLFARELNFKPQFQCLFDNDNEGREQSSKIKPNSCPNLTLKLTPLIRHDNASPVNVSGDWEIEDFIPPDLFLDCINLIIKAEGYAQITAAQKTNKLLPAHIGKQILKYAEECCSQNNPNNPPLLLDNVGRKMQICQKFSVIIDSTVLAGRLTNPQKQFLDSLTK